VARAAATQDMETAIVTAFRSLLQDRFYDEFSLDDIAAAAGTTRQTVIRRFGAKTGVLAAFTQGVGQEIETRRAAAPSDDLYKAAEILVADYEATGAMLLRLLALEGRIPDIEPTLEIGRVGHRKWVEATFAAKLAKLPPDARADRLAQLLVTTDVWSWFLFRQTQKKSVAESTRLIASMIEKLLQP
jgi:AcrR family transcriptional regulator